MYNLSNYVKPFKESEVLDIGLTNVNSHSLIDKHQMCIKILEGIIRFEQRKENKIESIEGFAGTFPELRKKYVNDIDTINRCIKRLEQRYIRVFGNGYKTSFNKYEEQSKILLDMASNKNISEQEANRMLACRRFVLNFINDLKNIK